MERREAVELNKSVEVRYEQWYCYWLLKSAWTEYEYNWGVTFEMNNNPSAFHTPQFIISRTKIENSVTPIICPPEANCIHNLGLTHSLVKSAQHDDVYPLLLHFLQQRSIRVLLCCSSITRLFIHSWSTQGCIKRSVETKCSNRQCHHEYNIASYITRQQGHTGQQFIIQLGCTSCHWN